MKTEELNEIKNWFVIYVRSFSQDNGDLHPFIELKVKHSARVAEDAKGLAEDLSWTSADTNSAEAAGWLHDIGRFSQFMEFGTFHDAESVNHGERGWEIVQQSDVLSALNGRDRECILDGIRYHNSKTIPKNLAGENLAFVRLIRDADKLDIFRVVHDAIEQDGFQELPEMLPQVALDGPTSPRVVQDLQKHQSCSFENVKSLADFLLMQISWIYDINYGPTFKRIAERKVISKIAGKLGQDSEAVNEIVMAAKRFVWGSSVDGVIFK